MWSKRYEGMQRLEKARLWLCGHQCRCIHPKNARFELPRARARASGNLQAWCVVGGSPLSGAMGWRKPKCSLYHFVLRIWRSLLLKTVVHNPAFPFAFVTPLCSEDSLVPRIDIWIPVMSQLSSLPLNKILKGERGTMTCESWKIPCNIEMEKDTLMLDIER